MRKLPDLRQFLFIFKTYFVYFFVILYFCAFFVNFGVLMNYTGLRNDHSETPAH